MRPRSGACLPSTCAIEGMCSFGTIRKCTGAHGLMSWKTNTSSSSCTFFEGIFPSTILQKMQFGSVCMSIRISGSARRARVVEAEPAADAAVDVPEADQRVRDPAGEHEEQPQRARDHEPQERPPE